MASIDPLEPLGHLKAPLHAVGELLDATGETYHLLVVGGVAILMHRIRTRTTSDVDVIARGEFDDTGKFILVPPDPLPPALSDAVERVARDFGLPADWLNAVIGRQWHEGAAMLPPGLLEETSWHAAGGLHIGIAGRRSLIALKLYAAADTGPGSVHTQDLLAIQPTREELEEARRWVQQQDPSLIFQALLGQVFDYVEGARDGG